MCSPIICCAIAANAAEVSPAAETGAAFDVRRSRPYVILSLAMTAAFVALALATLIQAFAAGTPTRSQTIAGLFFAVLLTAYLLYSIQQFRDPRPVMAITADGLHVPAARLSPIPWPNVRRVVCRVGLIGKGRIEIQVDAETYGSLKLGLRILGDTIVRRMSPEHTFAVLMHGTDRRALETYTAIRRYWTPPASAAGT